MEALVVVVNRDGQHLLRMVLADHIIVENLADFLRHRNAVARFHQRGVLLLLEDVLAQLNAFVANEHGRTGNKLAHLLLALAAERAVERILRIAAGMKRPAPSNTTIGCLTRASAVLNCQSALAWCPPT